MPTLLLTQSQVRSVLTMDLVVPAVERAFAAHGRGEARMPPKVYLEIPEHAGDFRAMPASLGDAAGVKWVSVYAENPSRHGLPSVMGLYILNHPDTALPAAVLDATLLTALRTGPNPKPQTPNPKPQTPNPNLNLFNKNQIIF